MKQFAALLKIGDTILGNEVVYGTQPEFGDIVNVTVLTKTRIGRRTVTRVREFKAGDLIAVGSISSTS